MLVLHLVLRLLCLVPSVYGHLLVLNNTRENWRICREIWGVDSWLAESFWHQPKSLPPAITIRFAYAEHTERDPIISVAIFNKVDETVGGIEHDGKKFYVCDGNAILSGLCEPKDHGLFLGELEKARYDILAQAVHLRDAPTTVRFVPQKSGIYCVEAIPFHNIHEFEAQVEFAGRRGELVAIQQFKLSFTAFMAILFFALSTAKSVAATLMPSPRQEASSESVSRVVFWLHTISYAILWTHMTYINRNGYLQQDHALGALAIALVASRNVATYLLCYSTVQSQVSKTMRRQQPRWATIASFVCAPILVFVLSAGREAELLRDRDERRDTIVLLATLATAAVVLLYHIMLLVPLRSLSAHWRRQGLLSSRPRVSIIVVWILVAVIVIMIGLDGAVLYSWQHAEKYGNDMLSKTWKARWFIIDEWQTCVYAANLLLVGLMVPGWERDLEPESELEKYFEIE